jgi:hypothetical protein
VTDYLRNSFQRKAHADAYAKWAEGVNRAIAHDQLESAWPSSTGGRGATSPLGGVALPAAEKEPG